MDQHAAESRKDPRAQRIQAAEPLLFLLRRAVERAAGVRKEAEHGQNECGQTRIAHLDHELEVVIVDVEIVLMVDDLILHGDSAAEHTEPHAGQLPALLEQRGKLTGVGLGMFGGAVAMQNQVIDHQDYFYVDNYYLKLMIEMGYTGLAAFVLTVLGFLANACRALYRTAQQKKQGLSRLYPLCAGIFAGLCGVLVHCGFENIFEEPYMMAYFWSLAGLLMWAGFLRQTPGEVQA